MRLLTKVTANDLGSRRALKPQYKSNRRKPSVADAVCIIKHSKPLPDRDLTPPPVFTGSESSRGTDR